MTEDKMIENNPFRGTESREKSKPKPKQREIVQPETEENETEDLLAGLVEKKPESKAYSIYLDVDVVEKLDQIADKNKSSRSKVVNTLLRNILNK